MTYVWNGENEEFQTHQKIPETQCIVDVEVFKVCAMWEEKKYGYKLKSYIQLDTWERARAADFIRTISLVCVVLGTNAHITRNDGFTW